MRKPEADHFVYIIKKLNIKKKDTVYIRDTYIDYLASRNANIDFIFAKWG